MQVINKLLKDVKNAATHELKHCAKQRGEAVLEEAKAHFCLFLALYPS